MSTAGKPRRTRKVWIGSGIEIDWKGVFVFSILMLLLVWFIVRINNLPGIQKFHLGSNSNVVLISGPMYGRCAVERDSGRVLGRIVGVLGRDGRPLFYRVQRSLSMHHAPGASFPFDVRISSVRVVRCRDVHR